METRATLRRSFTYLMAIVLLLFGIACANIAGLTIALTATRQSEIRVRLALGAGAARISRQLLTENILLALIGGGAALPFAWWGGPLLVNFFADESIVQGLSWTPDWRIFVFTLSIAILAGLFVGAVPAFRSAQVQLNNVVREGRSERRTRAAPALLLILQIGVTLMLVVGAGLMVRSFQKIRQVDAGFRPDQVLLFDILTSMAGYSGAHELQFYDDLADTLKRMPGVDSASYARFSPGNNHAGTLVRVAGDRLRSTEEEVAGANMVAPDYFKTVGINLVRGRNFDRRDWSSGASIAVVNQRFAQQYFGMANPIGRTFSVFGDDKTPIEIVGVVNDVKEHGLLEPAPRMIYLPIKHPGDEVTFFVRTWQNPALLIPSIRRKLMAMNPLVPLTNVKTLDLQLTDSVAQERLLALLSSIIGFLALAMASMGLYGMLNYDVSRETKSIGILMALGATTPEILWGVLKRVVLIVSIGLGTGLIGAFWLTRYLKSFLFGLTPTDPGSIAFAAFILLTVATIAAYLPARRASGIDPAVALHHE